MRVQSGFWDICFSEPPGIVDTSVSILGGMPGAGKSTIALQIARGVVETTGGEILYIPSEESVGQIKPRALRLSISDATLGRMRFLRNVSPEPSVYEACVKKHRPRILIVDSVSGLTRDPHAHVTICDGLKKIAQEYKCPVVCIDHITKQEDFAGLMKLQHAVDALIALSVKDNELRVMFPIKNRFGPTDKERECKMTMTAAGLIPFEGKKRGGRVKEGIMPKHNGGNL